MPNYVKNKVLLDGPADKIEELLNSIKSGHGDDINYIDFNKIIPMPESLKIESSSNTDKGIALIRYLNGDDSLLNTMLNYPWVKKMNFQNTQELYEYFHSKENYIEIIEIGKKAIYNIETHGHADWHSWSCDKWGTKWNSINSTVYENVIEFETAWTTPYPVIIVLSDMNPDIKFIVEYADEDIGRNCGRYILQAGNEREYEEYDEIKSCEIWGYDPADYLMEFRRDKKIDEIIKDV